ncbi:hypothetical protein OEZ85_009758 [Tetradesmus obliquus]|uniref:Beta'-coat protein n=1 Tax=Tetradesmus obliquus TaxID=3088 RepID=A0ABY8UCC0_TETOB|nr:hypothetical protein OEZ85_009758 [Tetradesmus obliquus]
MPLRLDVKKQLVQRTDRVKGVDLHPTEPWLLANLYNGNVYIWNYNDSTLVKSFEVTELPVRSAKFVARKQWVVCGADDMQLRVYNYNTMDKIKTFEAHTDYIRSIAVHPNLPYVLTSSDDMLIKLWDWDKGWACCQVFEGHSHYVMQVVFNPKDSNTFASASLDRTVKVWSLGQPLPNFTLEGHEKGVNCVDYFTGGDRPFLISGADDRLIKVWDYQTKACVQTLEGHAHNISAVAYHPELPIILSASEDGCIKMWHATTYRLENTLNYGMERIWAIGAMKGSNSVAFGFDEGVAVVKIGREEPVASMDASGKIIWARHNEVQTVNVKSLGADYQLVDGERLPLAVKDLGACDLYPQSLKHNPNGRFVTVCGDGEYVVYTALAWRNKSFGSAMEFVWSADSNDYAIREGGARIKIHKNFAEKAALKVEYAVEGIHGGALVGVRGTDFVCFYDWEEGRLVRRIDVGAVREVLWSDNGELVAIAGESSFYILQYNRGAVEAAFGSGAELDEDGLEDAFELVAEVPEKIRTGLWVGDCFIYNNAAWRLNYCVGGEVTTLFHLDKPMYLLGYLAAQSRVYLIDREFNIVSYTLLLSLIEFKTLVMRDQLGDALGLLPGIPSEQRNGLARFLEGRGLVQEALELATDHDYRFDLAIQLGDLETAADIANSLDTPAKWRQLGELALSRGQLGLAHDCLEKAKDMSGLLLLAAAKGDRPGLSKLLEASMAAGKHNVAFLCLFLLGQVDRCVALLSEAGRLPEAAMLARAYMPSAMSGPVKEWKKDLASVNPKAADALADPEDYPNLFPGLQEAVEMEAAAAAAQAAAARHPGRAFASLAAAGLLADDLARQLAALGIDGSSLPAAAPDWQAEANGGAAHTAAAVPPAAETTTVPNAIIATEDELDGIYEPDDAEVPPPAPEPVPTHIPHFSPQQQQPAQQQQQLHEPPQPRISSASSGGGGMSSPMAAAAAAAPPRPVLPAAGPPPPQQQQQQQQAFGMPQLPPAAPFVPAPAAAAAAAPAAAAAGTLAAAFGGDDDFNFDDDGLGGGGGLAGGAAAGGIDLDDDDWGLGEEE